MRAGRRTLLAVVAGALISLLWLPTGGSMTSIPDHPALVPAAVESTSYPWVYPPAGLGIRAIEPGVLQVPDTSVQPPSWIAIG